MIDNQDIHDALDRLARTADGNLLYRFLQKALCAVHAGEVSECALRLHEGRRIFAAELMGHMAEGIQDSDRTAITFSSSAAARTSPGPRGAARRVTLDTRVPGWDTPGNTAGADSAGRHGSDAA